MKYDEIEFAYCFAVFGLENVFVDVELKGVVPVVRVWKVFDGGVVGEFVGAVGFCDFAAAFPVVDYEGGRGRGRGRGASGGGGFNEFIYHID